MKKYKQLNYEDIIAIRYGLISDILGFAQPFGTYNIEASKLSGSMGLCHYNKFNLSQGDIVNLIYKDG